MSYIGKMCLILLRKLYKLINDKFRLLQNKSLSVLLSHYGCDKEIIKKGGKMKKCKSSFKTFLHKYILVEHSEEEKKKLPKDIFLISGIVFAFSSFLIFLNITNEHSSVMNFMYILIVICCIDFYKERRKNFQNEKKSFLSLILKIAFLLFLFCGSYLIFTLLW